MDKSQQIIHDLLFCESEEENLTFDLSGLEDYIEDYSDLVESIVRKINRGRIEIVKDIIKVQEGNVYWELKIKKSK